MAIAESGGEEITPKNLFVAGTPGVGKTTLIKEVTLPYSRIAGGFYTEQILDGRMRMGFRIVTFAKQEAILASKAMAAKARVNKYGVDLEALERVGVQSLARARQESRLIVIDEIGAMEMLSEAFREEVLACLSSPNPVLATVRRGAHAFTESILRFRDTKLLELERRNYNDIKQELQQWLRKQLER